jgi:hypothetical protein
MASYGFKANSTRPGLDLEFRIAKGIEHNADFRLPRFRNSKVISRFLFELGQMVLRLFF